MVRRAHNHGVELISKLTQKLAVIDILGGIFEFLGFGVESFFVDIADGSDAAMIAGLIDIRTTFATHTNPSDVQGIVWTKSSVSPSAIRPYGKTGDRGAEAFEKLTTIWMK
jgi:hypothetical protein